MDVASARALVVARVITHFRFQVAEETCRFLELDSLIQHGEDLLTCLDEEARVSETMLKLEVDSSPAGLDLRKANVLLQEAKSRY